VSEEKLVGVGEMLLEMRASPPWPPPSKTFQKMPETSTILLATTSLRHGNTMIYRFLPDLSAAFL
jgi:hypothetical protein